ncbi:MAG: type II secretion system F family protein [Methanomicrobiales archaeon]|nr:type II secretion system F family protein [Methanomicrobiales archaeon]
MGLGDTFNNFLNRSHFKREDAPEVVIDEYERGERHILEKISYQKKIREGLGRFLKHPYQFIRENPLNVLIISIPAALLVFLVGISLIFTTYGLTSLLTDTMVDDVICLSVLIAIVPLAILDFLEQKRTNSLEEALPNFFRDVAGMNDSGMTLPNAINNVASGQYGALTPFIRRLNAEMSWSVPFVEALLRFGKRVGTPLAERAVDLIAKASKAGGDASEVLRAAANDSYEFFNLKQERRNNMLIYMVIVIISFLVFLFVIAILESTFLTTMAEAGEKASAAGAGSFMAKVDIAFYKRLFSHAGMIQGFFSGLVAGQMGEGSAISGLKYSAIMLTIAWITFRFFI